MSPQFPTVTGIGYFFGRTFDLVSERQTIHTHTQTRWYFVRTVGRTTRAFFLWIDTHSPYAEDDKQTSHNSESNQTREICDKIDRVASTLKGMLQSGDPQLSSGVSKFIARFDKLSAPRLRPTLASEFHQFGWQMGITKITHSGQLRHSKRIAAQATAAGRRRKVKSHEREGRYLEDLANRHYFSNPNKPKGRRIHSQ